MFCGVAEASWTAIGLAAGTYLNWLIVARRLRRYSAATGAITVPDFLARRFRDKSKIIETVGALVIIIFFVPYTASGFAACGKLFNSLFGFDYMKAMLVSAAVIVAYCALGGFMAASVTSLIQSIVMTLALIIVLFFGVNTAGGWAAVAENARSIPGYLSLAASTDIVSKSAGAYTPIMVVSTLAWGLGYFGMPHILLHFMAVRDENELKISRRVGSVWCVVSLGVAVVIGIVGFGMARAGAIALPGSEPEAENLIVRTAALIASKGAFAAIVGGLILAGILAATMSTADAQLLAAASGVTQNLLLDVFGVKLSDKKNMLVARITVVGVAILGAICDPRRDLRQRSFQLDLPRGVLRLGRLRRDLRARDAPRAVLEALQPPGRDRGHDRRRGHDLRVEIPRRASRRRVRHLRAAARLRDLRARHRRGQPLHGQARGRDLRRIRRGERIRRKNKRLPVRGGVFAHFPPRGGVFA